MPKLHPTEEHSLDVFTPSEQKDFVGKYIHDVRRDERSRSEWLQAQRLYYNRRYCLEDRNTDWPWPGASDICMPLIDMTIDRLKAMLTRSVFPFPAVDRNVKFKTWRADLFDRAEANTKMLNWLQTVGMRDYQEQVVIGIDTVLQDGFCPFKTFWDRQIRPVKRIFKRADFLRRYQRELRQLQVEGLQLDPAINGKTLNARIVEAFKPVIAKDYGLDPTKSEADRKGLEAIMRLLRQGGESVQYASDEVVLDVPRTCAIDPRDLIVSGQTKDIQNAIRVTHRLFLSEPAFLDLAVTRKWNEDVVSDILKKRKEGGSEPSQQRGSSALTFKDFEKDHREGVFTFDTKDMVEVWETYFWHPFGKKNEKKQHQRAWMTLHPDHTTPLKGIRPNPYDHGETPFDVVQFELTDGRYYSPRGIPAKIDDIDWELTLRRRSRLNKMDMMVPMLEVSDPNIKAEDLTYVPAEVHHVQRSGTINAVPIPDYTIPDIREEQDLLAWNERYVGGFDVLASQQSIHEARTASEINAITRTGQEMTGLRVMTVQFGFNRISGKQWDLYQQFGKAEDFQKVTGLPFVRASKEEIRRDYLLIPVGSVNDINPTLEAQKAFARFTAVLETVKATGSTILDGTHEIRLSEALRRWLQRDSPEDADAVLRELTPQEQQALQQEQQRRAQLDELAAAEERNEPLTGRQLQELQRASGRRTGRGGLQRIATGG